MAGMEAGFSPFASATGVHIINGRPAFSANLLAQAVRRHPEYDYRVLEKTATACKIRFLSRGEDLGTETFTIDMAERAGLLKNPTWRSYPEAMLFSRALTAGMRTHCPDALGGHPAYTPEELGDADVVPVMVTEAPRLMLSQGAAQTLDQLPVPILQRLAKGGVSPETVLRCNGEPTTEDPDDLPAAWSA